jgi:LCP family protein required for cell wall assembly
MCWGRVEWGLGCFVMTRQLRKRPWWLLLSLVALSGWLVGVVWGLLTPRVPEGVESRVWSNRLTPGLKAPLDLLVMATDVSYAWHGGKPVLSLGGNTDTMLLTRFDVVRKQIRILSIPRDTRVPIRGHGVFKINAANPYGGPELSMETVAALTGIAVRHYIIFNPQAVITLVDALGGITLNVPQPMHYDDRTGRLHIHLSPGLQRLDGQKAHDYLRFRHDGQGDIGRVQRQQVFMEAVVRQCLTPVNLLATPRLLTLVKQHLSSNLGRQEWLDLIASLHRFKRESIHTATVPGREVIIQGGWYWQADVGALGGLIDDFYLVKPDHIETR